VDPVALASVITSGLVGGGGLGVAVWSRKKDAAVTQETLRQQRLADAYLELLRLVEQEGQWVEAKVSNLVTASEDELGIFKRMHVPTPDLADRSTAAALLAAVGSREVRLKHERWRKSVTTFEDAFAALQWEHQEHGDPREPLTADDLFALVHEVHPVEQAARSELAEAIARELGHR
jgi:hypothetical protein